MTRNGGVESPSPRPRIHQTHPHDTPHFHSTVSERKLRRFNCFIFIFRLAAFCFSLSAAVFMIATKSGSPRWYDFSAFRFVVAANGIVALYSLFEMVASAWEISRGSTILPEFYQVWFDFAHDQVFAYMLLSADSTGTEMARQLRGVATCDSFCVQSDIAVALGFAGFLFLMMSSLLSGFRVVCFIIKGSRFHV
ncbi:putative casparian strip membrane protein [Helianthus annuus]|uniref:CASP-like protein n=1 Tax=Helianthus annuus TaxID=4232 RepID=A0A251SM36_HELAN|nr:CASP-like protein 4C1 [Helianthus annuus]KAF5770872.1 putative casparian strip membrane protein [Helianthus annuus]KAJ0465734.1 putative casparian strip membrane protein [Helianthus annuus]KAJ0470629.1 putative casparian strip membrane protein [Helianthus annuus]KAJ0487328.1 putative casparian strip membrane protein [Helianthus annuus]KAJ0661440.1 putative casparian strip membrane protein [Helianthus annuus]